MEFWNELILDKSFKLLQELRKKIDFILIGGWAVYFLTKSMKSKDIDIIVEIENLPKLKGLLEVNKTDFLKKYEAEVEGISIDIYVPYYSKFVIPVEEIVKNSLSVEGFRVPKAEFLLLLKQQAELERKDSVKGQKDRADIFALLTSKSVDFDVYRDLIRKYSLEPYRKRLRDIVASASKEFELLGVKNPREIKKIKKDLISFI